MYEKDFLRGYELRNWDFTPRVYKIVGIAALANILALFVFAQTNLLTKKGCDSPFVSTVCQVLDTVYLSKALLGTDSEYIDRKYDPTIISESDEITFIDVSNENLPLSYPAGYFPLANPNDFMTNENGDLVRKDDFVNMTDNPFPQNNYTPTPNPTPYSPPVVKNNPSSSLLSKKPKHSKPKNPVISDKLPTSTSATDDGDEGTEGKDKTTDVAKNEDDKKVDKKTATDSDPVTAVEINRRPLEDVGEFAKVTFSPENDYKGEIEPFKVVLNGKLKKKPVTIKDEKGKDKEIQVVAFDSENTSWDTKAETGDKEMIELAKQSIEAVGDSGFLGYLYNQGADSIQITLEQVDDKVITIVKLGKPTIQSAKTLASGLNGLLVAEKLFRNDKPGDEKILLDGVKPPTSEGKFVIINVELSKEEVQKMIQRNLKKAEEKKQQKKNSTAQTVSSNLRTGE